MIEYGLFLLTQQQLDQGITFNSKAFYDEDNPLTLKEHVKGIYYHSHTPDAWENYDCVIEASSEYKRHLELGYAVALVNYCEGAIVKTSYPDKD